MFYIAHRGYMYKDKIDNSSISIYNAYHDDFFSGIEIDVRETKDKKIVLCHNPVYKNKIIKKTNYKDIKELLLLENVLKKCLNKIILIEIKDYYLDIKLLNEIITKSKHQQVYVMSFYNTIIKKLYKLEVKFKLGVLNYIFNSEKDYFYLDFLCLLKFTITFRVEEYLKNKNIKLFVYGILNENANYICNNCYLIVDNKRKIFIN